jgi:AraC-like DNA-binding protein
MNAVPLVRVAALIPFLRFLEHAGSPARRRAPGSLPSAALEDPEALVSMHQVCAFVEDAARREGIADLGFRVGERTSIEALGAYGALVRRSLTLHDALRTTTTLHAHFSSGARIWFVREGDGLWLHHRFDHRLGEPRVAGRYTLMLLLRMLQLGAGDSWRTPELRLPESWRADRARLEEWVDGPIRFGPHPLGILVPSFVLAQPLDRSLGADKLEEGRRLRLESTGPSRDLVGSVRQLIGPLLAEGAPDVRLVADAAGMSVRTLQRRLAAHGHHYSRLVERERFDRAVLLLRDPRARVTDVALQLGYTDPANFTHAFRRWAGIPPRAFRESSQLAPVARSAS